MSPRRSVPTAAWGASIARQADADHLQEAYGHFKAEAQNGPADYQPPTVSTDGGQGTRNAGLALFPKIAVILCFLHGFLTIRDRRKRLKPHLQMMCMRVWDSYHATTAPLFLAKINKLKARATKTLEPGPGLEAILKLCDRAPAYAQADEYPLAYRTSNMLDRQMDRMDRCFYSAKYFHGHLMTAEYGVRSWALLHNFLPYCPRAGSAATYQSPAHKLNGVVYHDNGLQNLLVSAAMGGFRG